VHAGTYREEVTITKTVSLVPFGDGPVSIDAECIRETGLTISGANDVLVRGILVKRPTFIGIVVGDGAARATIDGNTVQDYNCTAGAGQSGDQLNSGIAAYYAGPGQRITNNTITRRVQLPGPKAGQGDGIWFKSNSENPSGGGHYIAGNTIVGGFDGIGGEVESDIHGSFDRDTLIENNTISFCGDDGIQVEGGDVNVTVRNNTIRECGSGISFAPNLIGPLFIQGNTIISSTTGILGNWMCFKIGQDMARSGLTYISDNVCQAGDGIQQTNGGIGRYITSNNKFTVSAYIFELFEMPAAGSSFNNDCMISSDTNGRFTKWNGTVYSTLAAFRSASGHEANGRLGPC